MRSLRHGVLLGALLALVASVAASCGGTATDTVGSGSITVKGTVLLSEPAGVRPGGGLLVSALSPKSGVQTAVTRTTADGGFHFALGPGFYLLTVNSWGGPALQVQVPRHGSVQATIRAPSESLAARQTVSVTGVPDAVPPSDVWIAAHLALLEPPPVPAHIMTAAQAITVARRDASKTLPMRALLAVVTVPGEFVGNPGVPGTKSKPLRHWLAWVVTSTLPQATNGDLGGPAPQPGQPYIPPPPHLVSGYTMLLDARTGQFLLGFLTR